MILGIAPTIQPLKSFVDDLDLLNKYITDPNRYLIGRHVKIIYKSQYKAYRGVVKEVLQDDFVIVELEANARRHRVRLANLTLMYVQRKRNIFVSSCSGTGIARKWNQSKVWIRAKQ